jgi:hypothetical protein
LNTCVAHANRHLNYFIHTHQTLIIKQGSTEVEQYKKKKRKKRKKKNLFHEKKTPTSKRKAVEVMLHGCSEDATTLLYKFRDEPKQK